MTSASHLFHTFKEMELEGATLQGENWQLNGESYLPLYEAKMVHHYDHRWATYETDGETSRDCTLDEKRDSDYSNMPRYWVEKWQVTLRTTRVPKELLDAVKKDDFEKHEFFLKFWTAGGALTRGEDKQAESLIGESLNDTGGRTAKAQAMEWLAEEWPLVDDEYQELLKVFSEKEDVWPITRELMEQRCPRYLLGWRDICRATDERTVIAGVIPLAAVGDTFLLMFPNYDDKRKVAGLLADQCSLVHDYVARQKIGGTHLKYHMKKQIVNLLPDQYLEDDLSFIVPRVLELTYTSHSLKPWAEDLGYSGEPFSFEPIRRHQLKCELDAYYAKLYGLTRDELRYILDPANVMGEDYPSETFRVLKNKEIKGFGEYRTQRLVLEAYDKLN